MSKLKRFIITILCIIDLYFLYATIGYLVLGIKTPKIIGETNTTFMGMYIMSMTFFALFIVLSTIITIILIKYSRKKKQTK